jgi:uncharacterized SAM-binding protein YcdF (DUF218 family)
MAVTSATMAAPRQRPRPGTAGVLEAEVCDFTRFGIIHWIPMTLLLRLLGAGLLVAFALAAFSPLPNRVAALVAVRADPGRADAIVVLGGGAEWPHGELSSTALHRTIQGIRLYKEGLAPLLVLSGAQGRTPPTPSARRRALALACDIPRQAIVTDEGATTTRDETDRVAGLLRPRGVRTILLVTDPYHMVRARYLFERAGFAVRAVPASDLADPAEAPGARLALMTRAAQEILAIVYYRIAGYM